MSMPVVWLNVRVSIPCVNEKFPLPSAVHVPA